MGKGKKAEAAWQKKYAAYAKKQPEPAKERQAARMVSMPSWELYEKTTQQYKDAVLPPQVTAPVAVEAGLSMGWERYVGSSGAVIGINCFGTSAPGQR